MNSPKLVTVLAPAKINWVLEILKKREDGFHDLKLVFQAVDMWDQLTFERRDAGVRFKVLDGPPGLPDDGRNLVVQAASKFLDEVLGGEGGVHITLKKRIPLSAGLGGGSSDAAATLLGMDKLFGTGVYPEELADMASELGSDVAFFLTGGAALGEGRGERITPWPGMPSMDLVLVKPDTGLSTSEVYQSGMCEFSPGRLASAFRDILATGDKAKIGRSLHNGLERAAFHFLPLCMEIKMELKEAGALGALVSGSGPTVFALCASREQAEKIASKATKKGRKVFVTHTIPDGMRFG